MVQSTASIFVTSECHVSFLEGQVSISLFFFIFFVAKMVLKNKNKQIKREEHHYTGLKDMNCMKDF